jgi:integrase
MAWIGKLKNGKWRVQVRRNGYPSKSKLFLNKADAERWAHDLESKIARGAFLSTDDSEKTTLSEALDSFENKFAPFHYKPRADKMETWRFQCAHLRHGLGKYYLGSITPVVVAKYRDDRLGTGLKGSTVKKELDLLSKVFGYVMGEMNITLPAGNPVDPVRKPKESRPRERRLSKRELGKVLAECEASRNPWLYPAAMFAIATAMRQGEMLLMEWERVRLDRKVAVLPDENVKNGEGRSVPLSSGAIEILKQLKGEGRRERKKGRVFPVERMTLYHAFIAACKRAGVEDFTWHDLRHEALSRLAERGDLTVIELASISGHKTLQMLKRYTHLHAENLAIKLG